MKLKESFMKTYSKLIILSLVLGTLAACENSLQEESKNTNFKSEETQSDVKEVNTEITKDVMEGITVHEFDTQKSGYSVITGTNLSGEEVIGILDPEFNWMLEPSTSIKKVSEMSNGLMGVAIHEDREIRAIDSELLWGYIDDQGEWAIKPQFQAVGLFSEGLALVETIEEDRDDLANSRGIVINEKGEEEFEIAPSNQYSYLFEWWSGEDLNYELAHRSKFTNGTVSINFVNDSGNGATPFHIIADKDGNIYDWPTKQEPSNMQVEEQIGYEVYEIQGDDVEQLVLSKNVKTGETSQFKIDKNLYVNNHNKYISLFHNNQFLTANDKANGFFKVFDKHGKDILKFGNQPESNYMPDYSGNDWVTFENDTYREAPLYFFSKNPLETKEFILEENQRYAAYKDRIWEEGNEYFILKNSEGEVLLGEDKKIIIDYFGFVPGEPIHSVYHRPNSTSVEKVPAIVNTETGKFMSLEDWNIVIEQD